jgi:hypothetical protein
LGVGCGCSLAEESAVVFLDADAVLVAS